MKYFIAIVLAVIITGGIAGGYFYPKATASFGASPTNSTFTNAKQNSIVVNFANATSTYILNQTGNDLYVSASKVGCEGVGTSLTPYTGVGLVSWQLTIATTSTNVPGTTINKGTAPILNAFVLGTSTANLLVASSTLLTATSSYAAVWNAGSYMAFQTNATNTAVCTVGVDEFSS